MREITLQRIGRASEAELQDLLRLAPNGAWAADIKRELEERQRWARAQEISNKTENPF